MTIHLFNQLTDIVMKVAENGNNFGQAIEDANIEDIQVLGKLKGMLEEQDDGMLSTDSIIYTLDGMVEEQQ